MRLLLALAGTLLFAQEVLRYHRRRQNLEMPQEPVTDRWLRRFAWCAVAFLVFAASIVVNHWLDGPDWILMGLFAGILLAAAGVGLCIIVLGWRNGLRIARSMNWL